MLKRYLRKAKLTCFLLRPGKFRQELKIRVNDVYRRHLSSRYLQTVSPEDLLDWSTLELKLASPTTRPGHTSKLEMLVILALLKKYLGMNPPGAGALEIGTFDGNTALNASLNLPAGSTFYTIDLPEDATSVASETLQYDTALVFSSVRKEKKHLSQPNVVQIYSDSRNFDFSSIAFNFAFIDGAHDYATVKLDTANVLRHIRKPGCILWHDYDVENDVGLLLHELSGQYGIKWIEGTRMGFLDVR
jgi:predicted O-methyltransferase YrrM